VNKIHHKFEGNFVGFFMYFRSDLCTADGTCLKKILEIVEEKKIILSSDILSLCVVQRRCLQYRKQNQKQTVNSNKHFKLHIM